MTRTVRMIVAAVAAGLIAVLGIPGFAVAAPSSDISLTSSTPKTVTLDSHTGKVLSVVPGEPNHTDVSLAQTCNSGWSCTNAKIPYKRYSWAPPAGTTTVNWPGQLGFSTGGYTSASCWSYQGSTPCSNFFGPNTTASYSGAVVTVVQVAVR